MKIHITYFLPTVYILFYTGIGNILENTQKQCFENFTTHCLNASSNVYCKWLGRFLNILSLIGIDLIYLDLEPEQNQKIYYIDEFSSKISFEMTFVD